VAYSPDGGRLATAAKDQTVRVWDARSGKPLATLAGHSGGVVSVAYSPDGGRLATASGDRTVRLWDARGGAHLATLAGHTDNVTGVAYSPDGQRLASASGDETVRLWDARSRAPLVTLAGHTGGVNGVAYSPDGRCLASAGDTTVRLWDARTCTHLATLAGHTSHVSGVAYSADGQSIASASHDTTVRLWDARSGKPLATLAGHTDRVDGVALSPDGQRLASASWDKTVRLWDAHTGAHLATLAGHTGWVNRVAYSPDGQRLASASWDKTVRLWDARSGKPLATLAGHTDYVTGVAYSPDGRCLASASFDTTVRVWDAHTGTPLATLTGHTGWVKGVVFNPDGQRLASAGDKTVRLWDARAGTLLAALAGPTGGLVGVAYSSDGQKLYSQDRWGSALAWDAKTRQRVPPGPKPLPVHAGFAARHPSQPILALATGTHIELIDLRPLDPIELGYREWMARFDAPWQEQQARKHEEAKAWFAAAFHWVRLAQHAPAARYYWQKLEAACDRLGDRQPALAVCDRLLRHDPTLAPIYFRRARLRAHLWQFHEATADHLAGLALAARNPVGWRDFAADARAGGDDHAQHSDWPAACRAFAAAAMWERQDSSHRHRLAWAQIAAGQKAAFVTTCRDLHARYRTTADVASTYRLAAELCLGLSAEPSYLRGLGAPTADALLQQMQRQRQSDIVRTACLAPDHGLFADDLVRLAQANAEAHHTADVLGDLGAAQYRAGRFADAATTLEEAIKLQGKGGTNWMKLFLALAYYKQGQAKRAREWLAQAALPSNADWQERLILDRLRAEAIEAMKRAPDPKQ
jgi:WD40 repeat protein